MKAKKPLIGIGTDVGANPESGRDRAFAYMTYVEALRMAGAIPVLIPPQPENISALLDELDGVLLAGGADCDPSLYGEEPHSTCSPMDRRRQENDIAIAARAREKRVPTLGICLGLQVMAVAAGGKLIQDIDSEIDTDVDHVSRPENRKRHDIEVERGSRLAGILKNLQLNVNSSHHQAIRTAGLGLRITARAPDGVIEGIEDPEHPFYVGVQWHPEDMTAEASGGSLFSAFIRSASEHANREELQAASSKISV